MHRIGYWTRLLITILKNWSIFYLLQVYQYISACAGKSQTYYVNLIIIRARLFFFFSWKKFLTIFVIFSISTKERCSIDFGFNDFQPLDAHRMMVTYSWPFLLLWNITKTVRNFYHTKKKKSEPWLLCNSMINWQNESILSYWFYFNFFESGYLTYDSKMFWC